ncbi:PDZ domain-containing protein [Flavobacterium galactosidilyticum]|uniref:PDZ domain-containing protein n=1 Tax=Flavobacterium galactosidilyticum TaxID=2893886 RepID=UPI001E392188|nr:PDZ domain-containing protein [Flavobacterium sp. F-340]UFH46488.1 PDZ domain-containing protein [Flavobacterium sp. F-340]
MAKRLLLLLLNLFLLPVFAQQGFQFEKEINKVSVPFKLINNLIFVPIKVNGVELNFLLDTGVSETILFSLEEKKEVLFSNTEKILLKGLGNQIAVEGLKSKNNVLEFSSLKMPNHLLYIVLDPDFNLSSHIGIPVNGIVGYQFFRNNLVEINYRKKKIIVFKDIPKNRKKIERKFDAMAITVEKFKPYIKGIVTLDDHSTPLKLLVDIGNSDAVWLFQDRSKFIKVPEKSFDDYLGKGFSGDVLGKRGKIERMVMSNFEFNNPIAAFPDSSSIRNVTMVPDRMGSVGGEIMKRFDVVFDYQNEQLFLKKNSNYSQPFSYNKSGVEIQHNGLQWVQETVPMEMVKTPRANSEVNVYSAKTEFKYKFQVKPLYEIANVRANSPAAIAGLLKGDIIIKINNNPTYKYSLQDIITLFRSDVDKWITLEIERKNESRKFKFQLNDIL